MDSGIKDILIITKTEFLAQFTKLLGNGSKFGIKITFATQEIQMELPKLF